MQIKWLNRALRELDAEAGFVAEENPADTLPTLARTLARRLVYLQDK